MTTNTPQPNCGVNGYAGGTVQASDGSGLSLTVSNYNGYTVYSPSGLPIGPVACPTCVGFPSGSIADPNGNNIYFDTTGSGSSTTTTFTDTLGTTALKIIGTPEAGNTGSVCSLHSVCYQYSDSSGASEPVQVNYEAVTVRTNFECSGVAEFFPQTEYLVSSIVLADGETYSFQYEPTPGYPADTTGRLTSVTLPTGGTITYSYSGGNNGIVCTDGSTATLTRVTPDDPPPDESWKYAHSEIGTAWSTTVTDPASNDKIYNFQGIYETERQIQQAGTTLETLYTCYNGASSPCNSTAVSLPITRVAATTQYNDNSNNNKVESEVATSFNSYGLPTETDEYQFATGAPGPVFRKTLTAYCPNATYCPSVGNALDRAYQVQVENSAGTVVGQTNNYYSGNANLTKEVRSNSPSNISRSFTYNTNGTLATSTDFNGNRPPTLTAPAVVAPLSPSASHHPSSQPPRWPGTNILVCQAQ